MLKNKVRNDVKIKFYKTINVSCCIYVSETDAVIETDKQHIKISEIRFLQSVAECKD